MVWPVILIVALVLNILVKRIWIAAILTAVVAAPLAMYVVRDYTRGMPIMELAAYWALSLACAFIGSAIVGVVFRAIRKRHQATKQSESAATPKGSA